MGGAKMGGNPKLIGADLNHIDIKIIFQPSNLPTHNMVGPVLVHYYFIMHSNCIRQCRTVYSHVVYILKDHQGQGGRTQAYNAGICYLDYDALLHAAPATDHFEGSFYKTT
jgi:hypothetical protein